MQFLPMIKCELYTQSSIPHSDLSISHAQCATNNNFIKFSCLSGTKSYVPINGCVLEHILTTTNLTNHEKLYYLLADSLALINSNSGKHRAVALPSEKWATRLECCRSQIFAVQKNLEKKGYFIISKDKNEHGQNKRNLIIPTLPNSVFDHLTEKFPDKLGEHLPYNPLTECKRAYLDRTKLFIKLNYNLLEIISSNKYLNPQQKIIWLGFYTRCYKNYMRSQQEDSNFSFISSYLELASTYSCNKKHLSKSIRILAELGFIKTDHFYTRRRNEYDCTDQERQDHSLWKITLSLPNNCALELEQVKTRSNLKLMHSIGIYNHHKPNLTSDSLTVETTKEILRESYSLKSIIDNADNIYLPDDYIDSVMTEFEILEDLENINLSNTYSETLPPQATFTHAENNDNGIADDPHVAKFKPLLNKDLKLKIKDIKSNLRAAPKVLFNKFLRRFKKDDYIKNEQQLGTEQEFNIHSELIREKLKLLPQDKADKARKFAYSLLSKKLATGYAASLTKHDLAKQLIHHAASWKPTKLGNISKEQEIDIALAIAWKAVVNGTWQMPLELAKAELLQYEFSYYRRKYQESGILSHEIKSLESVVSSLLGRQYDLVGRITRTEGNVTDSVRGIDTCTYSSHTNTPFALRVNKSDFLTANSFSNEVLVNKDYRPGGGESGYQKNSSLPEDSNINYSQGYDYLKIEQHSSYYNISLSHVPEEQKYLKVIPSSQDGDNSIKLETTNGREYFVKLKELEMNDCGELVMTLKPAAQELFSVVNKNSELFLNNSHLTLTNNLIADNLDNQQEQPLQHGFIKINAALSGILKNLQHKIE